MYSGHGDNQAPAETDKDGSLLKGFRPARAADRKVAGGVTVPGWKGKEDAGNKQGLTVNDSKFAPEGKAFRLTTGPAGLYWSDSNTAKGDYSVKATFTEASQTYNHPHPFGVFIGGDALDSGAPAAPIAPRTGTATTSSVASAAASASTWSLSPRPMTPSRRPRRPTPR